MEYKAETKFVKRRTFRCVCACVCALCLFKIPVFAEVMLDRAFGNRIKMPWQIYGQGLNWSVRIFPNTFFQTNFFSILITYWELQRVHSKSFANISNVQ